MTPTPREEFEKAFKEKFGYGSNLNNIAIWSAQWMAEYLASKADENTDYETRNMIESDEIRTLAKQMEKPDGR